MVKEITRNALRGIIGTVQYAREFLTLAEADKKRAEDKAIEETKFNERLQPLSEEQSENAVVNEQSVDTNIQDTVVPEPVTPLNEQEIQAPENIEAEVKTVDPGKTTGEIESLI
jgi:hypothetical protein